VIVRQLPDLACPSASAVQDGIEKGVLFFLNQRRPDRDDVVLLRDRDCLVKHRLRHSTRDRRWLECLHELLRGRHGNVGVVPLPVDKENAVVVMDVQRVGQCLWERTELKDRSARV
jgi:hypothetical protein